LALAACRSARPWIERIDTPTYLNTSYYGRWLLAAEMGAVANGLVTVAELVASRRSIERGTDPTRHDDSDKAGEVAELMASTFPSEMAKSPRFAVGDAVTPKRLWEPDKHHRCPRYVRGARGVVERICGEEPVAGDRRNGAIEALYTVRFDSTAVWGERTAEPSFVVHVDLWESYLEPA
jgi:nitrile hydratase